MIKQYSELSLNHKSKSKISLLTTETNVSTSKTNTNMSTYTKTIKISDLDVNNHVNNTNYLSYALDCLDIESYSKHIK